MALGGIIAGALGGGAQAVGQIADTQIQTNARMDLARMENDLAMQRATAVARLQQSIGREDALWRTKGEGGEAELEFSKRKGDQETEQLVGREQKLTPVMAEREGIVGAARGKAERENLAAYAGDDKARAGVRAKTADQESNSSKVAASAAQFELAQKRAVMDLRQSVVRLRQAGNEEGAAQTEAMIATLTGASQSKNYGDMVKAADVYAKMASDQAAILADPVKSAQLSDEDRTRMQQNIDRYQTAADSILQSTSTKRGVPAKPGGPPKPGAPEEGQTGTSRSGKPIVYRNGQWVYQ